MRILPPMNSSRLLALVLASLLLGGCQAAPLAPRDTESSPQRATIKLGRVTRGDITGLLSFSGELRSESRVVVAPRVAGTLARIIPDVGARVNEGDPVAELDKGLLEAEVQRAQAALSAAEARKAKLQSAARPEEVAMAQALANAAQARLNDLQAGGTVTPTQALAALAAARQHLAELEGANLDALAKAQQALDSAQSQLDSALKDQSSLTRDRVDQARAAVAAARQQLQAARQPANPDELAKARDAVAQAEHQVLLSAQAGSPNALTEAQAYNEAAQQRLRLVSSPASDAEIAAAQAEIDQAGAALELARQGLRNATLTAPISGVVTARFVPEGSLVGPGVAVLEIAPPELNVEFHVPEAQVANVADKQEVTLSVAAYPQETFSGVVSGIAPAVDPRDHTLLVRATITDPQNKLKAGMFAHIGLSTGTHEGALLVPLEALVSQGDTQFVWQIVDGRAKRQVVKVGLQDAQRAEVLDGLDEGAEVILSPGAEITEGLRVIAQ